jgi:glycosyltransferase involved in cell wall biosynthesis
MLSDDESIPLIGGAELQQAFVAKELVKRGFSVTMICLDFGQKKRVEIDGVEVIRAYNASDGIPILRYVWPRLTTILSCLKEADADIYYVRTASMLTGVIAAFCRRYSRKSVFAAAGNPDLEIDTPRIRYARDRWVYEYGLRNVDKIFVQNEKQKQLCFSNFHRDSIVVPNCYPSVNMETRHQGECILWVSTIRQLKRPHVYLDIAEALPRFQFRMIGGMANDERDLYESVKARADALANVEFLGFVPFSKIDVHFAAASVFVNTSESEGFPNTFIQAWAAKVPTVSFVDSGARYDGQIVGRLAKSSAQMAEIIGYWLQNESERVREGLRCHEYVHRNHSPERILEMYERLFCNIYGKVTK